MKHSRINTRRRASVIAVVLAGGATGLGGAVAVAEATRESDPRIPSALVEYVRANELTGLSPASLRPVGAD